MKLKGIYEPKQKEKKFYLHLDDHTQEYIALSAVGEEGNHITNLIWIHKETLKVTLAPSIDNRLGFNLDEDGKLICE